MVARLGESEVLLKTAFPSNRFAPSRLPAESAYVTFLRISCLFDRGETYCTAGPEAVRCLVKSPRQTNDDQPRPWWQVLGIPEGSTLDEVKIVITQGSNNTTLIR
jgi:hypothetical protein